MIFYDLLLPYFTMKSSKPCFWNDKPAEPISVDMEVRLLPVNVRNRLAAILDGDDSWKELATVIIKPDTVDQPLFAANDIRTLENEKSKASGSPTQVLLHFWSTSGRNRIRVGQLLQILTSIQLIRAAHYLAVEVLGQEPPISEINPTICTSRLYADANKSDINQLPAEGALDSIPNVVKDGIPIQLDSLPHYSYHSLERATQRFNDISVKEGGQKLGAGAFGAVYLAQLPDLGHVAVKRLSEKVGQQFATELQVFTRFSHPNLLPLLGYSVDGCRDCLIYEYLSNGSLEQVLFDKMNPVPWQSRVSIAVGTAQGINHLHTFDEKPFVHRDIKSANILLDANFVPKVGDFGLVRLGTTATSIAVVTSNVSGTSPYMAPEAFRGDVSSKLDTFAFGVVLLELLTSLPPYDSTREDVDLLSHMEENCKDISELLDKKAGEWNLEIARNLYNISVTCTKDKKRERPTLEEVLPALEELLTVMTLV